MNESACEKTSDNPTSNHQQQYLDIESIITMYLFQVLRPKINDIAIH
jgi:hypothetical protein